MVEKETGAKRSLQLVLYRDGSIEFNYRDIKGCRPLLAGLFSGTGCSSGTEIHFSHDLPFFASTTAIFENFHQALRRYIHQRTLPLEFALSDTLFEGEDIYTVILHDLSEHKQLIEEKMKLEEQLHQSQKLETIGTLAGGIAHDFNNILTPLIGYTELAMEHIPPDNAVHNYLKNILHSSNRAKDLVKQILSFHPWGR